MPRVCTVCAHPEREAIDLALVNGEPMRAIAGRYDVARTSLQRHQEAHLPEALLKADESKAVAHSIDIMGELQECIARVSLLSDACDRWLRDPDDPTRYDVGPRAQDVKVTYEEEAGTPERPRTIRKKAPLSELLARVEGRYTVTAVETKHTDPRELLLKSYDRLQGRLELVAKLLGELASQPTVNVTISPQWIELRTLIVSALEPYAEAREALAQVLAGVPDA
jgi:hypothetical protein